MIHPDCCWMTSLTESMLPSISADFCVVYKCVQLLEFDESAAGGEEGAADEGSEEDVAVENVVKTSDMKID